MKHLQTYHEVFREHGGPIATSIGMALGVVGRTALVIAGLALIAASPRGHVQASSSERGAPYDWSHRHLIASRFGPDLDRGISSDWRTFIKQTRIDQANQARAAREPRIGWFDPFGRRLLTPPSPTVKLDWSLQTGGYGSAVGDPAKYSFNIAAFNCADVIYFSVDQPGSATAVNVVAITNAYATCTGNPAGTTPTVKFGIALTTGTATSVVPSLDGTVLYVFESKSAGLILHAINVNNITSNPGVYNFGTNKWTSTHTLATTTGLPATGKEQTFQVTFANVTNDVSSPYLDYSNNQIFFGDASGKIHRVINTLSTTASEDVTHFPVACGTSQLTSPVFVTSAVAPDGQVIVSSANGFLYRIDTTLTPPYTSVAAAQGGVGVSGGAAGGLSSPVVDVTNSTIIVTGGDAFLETGSRGIGVYPLMFTAGASITSGVPLGQASAAVATTPALDNLFYTTNNGNLYAAGTPSSGSDTYLIKIPYNGTISTPTGYAALHRTTGGAAADVQTTAVTEFLTGSAQANPDFIFIGGSGGTYLFMNRIASGFAGVDGTAVPVASDFAAPGGVASGISIDTDTTAVTGTTATANIYYGTVGIASTVQSTIVQLAQQF
jgi:hypothetical protein